MRPKIMGNPSFILTLDSDLSNALIALEDQADYPEIGGLSTTILGIMLFGLVSNIEEVMRAFERVSVHYKNPHSEGYHIFWSDFQVINHVFEARYRHDHDLKNRLYDILPFYCGYCDEGLLHIERSRSGRHFHIS